MSGDRPKYVHVDRPTNDYQAVSVCLARAVNKWTNAVADTYGMSNAVRAAIFNALLNGIDGLYLASAPELRRHYIKHLRLHADDLESGKVAALNSSKGQA